MIHDNLNSLSHYQSVIPNFLLIEKFFKETDWRHLPPGRYPLDGDCLFVNVDLTTYRTKEEALLENHKNYIDLQIPLEVPETMGWTSLECCSNVAIAYNKEKDIMFWNDAVSDYCHVLPTEFVLFFPSDAHSPAIGQGTHKKIVIKIQINTQNKWKH